METVDRETGQEWSLLDATVQRNPGNTADIAVLDEARGRR